MALNDLGLLGEVLGDIYPPEMVVNNTNVSPCKSTYLDLNISLYRGKFTCCLYDKRKDFSFDVITYPFLDGNIPKAQTYGIFISQLVRFCTVNSTLKGFLGDTKDLVNKLVKQHFDIAALRNKFNKFYKNYYNLWGKYGVDIRSECNTILNL